MRVPECFSVLRWFICVDEQLLADMMESRLNRLHYRRRHNCSHRHQCRDDVIVT